MTFSKHLRNFRINKLALTQKVFAQKVGCSRVYLSQIENGLLRPGLTLAKIKKLMREYNYNYE